MDAAAKREKYQGKHKYRNCANFSSGKMTRSNKFPLSRQYFFFTRLRNLKHAIQRPQLTFIEAASLQCVWHAIYTRLETRKNTRRSTFTGSCVHMPRESTTWPSLAPLLWQTVQKNQLKHNSQKVTRCIESLEQVKKVNNKTCEMSTDKTCMRKHFHTGIIAQISHCIKSSKKVRVGQWIQQIFLACDLTWWAVICRIVRRYIYTKLKNVSSAYEK